MKIDHRQEVAGYALVVRTVFTDLETYGRIPPPEAVAALIAVETWVKGKEISPIELQSVVDLSFQTGVPLKDREKDRSLSWARTAAGNLAWFAKKERGWQNTGSSIMDAAFYALSSLNIPGVRDDVQLNRLRSSFMAQFPTKSKQNKQENAHPIPPNLTQFIGAAANDYLARLHPVFDPESRCSDAELRSLLTKHNYVPHDFVIDFDLRYGGLVVADSPGNEGEDWIFGVYACLKSGAHVHPEGKDNTWIPVAYSPNDYIFFLDDKGVAWMIDSVGDPEPERFADNPDAMMTLIFMDKK